MVEVNRHPKVQVIANAEVLNVEGYVGNFKVKVRKNPRYVIPERCTGCGECKDVCPIEYPNDWDINLGVRKAISIPFDQAVPLIFSINRDFCIECYKCVDACGTRKAINFDQKPEEVELEVGTIIVSTGSDIYEPYDDARYGYGRYDNVLTALEFERLITAGGPTTGHVLRKSDGKTPKSVAIIQCVGSRDLNKYEYCSGFCCMYGLKEAILLKEHYHDDVEVYIFYMDIRTPSKGYEEFYRRAREYGINFIRGKPSQILEDPKTKNLLIRAEDTTLGQPIEVETELVVLSTAAIPSKGAAELASILHITRGSDGFFMESHPKLKPMDTPMDGVFLAGSCQGPKDIPYSVAQGSGAAARAATILSQPKWKIEPIVSIVDDAKCRNVKGKCGVCAKSCPFGAITINEAQPARINAAQCHGCGTCVAECPQDAITQLHFTDEQILSQIRAALETNPDEKILTFMCNW